VYKRIWACRVIEHLNGTQQLGGLSILRRGVWAWLGDCMGAFNEVFS